jgi:2-dehydropantoate 2-reductase
VLGGLCFVCLNRVEPGVIHHLAHGRIVMGEYGRPAGERALAIAGWLRDSGTPCEVVDNLEQAHWEKLVWNIAFNGLGVAAVAGLDGVREGRLIPGRPPGACLPTDGLLADPEWESLVLEVMRETIAAARAQGLAVPESAADEQVRRTREMGTYRASTLIDYERGLPLELESLFGEPLRRARRAGVPVPRLAALHAVLSALDPATSGGRG